MRAFLSLENASLTLIQGRGTCIEAKITNSRSRFRQCTQSIPRIEKPLNGYVGENLKSLKKIEKFLSTFIDSGTIFHCVHVFVVIHRYFKNRQLQTQLSQKLQRFRICRKNKKCSIFHELFEYQQIMATCFPIGMVL